MTAAEIRQWTTANLRARAAYRAHPTACADWCPACVWPVTKRSCDHCKAVMLMRTLRAARKGKR